MGISCKVNMSASLSLKRNNYPLIRNQIVSLYSTSVKRVFSEFQKKDAKTFSKNTENRVRESKSIYTWKET